MVKVKYYPDATLNECQESEHDSIGSFIRSTGLDKTELVKLRFYDEDVLHGEIDTSDGSFITMSEGEITVINGETVPEGGFLKSALHMVSFATDLFMSTVGSVIELLIPMPETPQLPDTGKNRTQSSTTNRLGATNNELVSPNTRIDDIFGTVTKHIPKMWQTPYRIGVNNQETEILLLCVGRGKYQIDPREIYDGETRYINIPGSAVDVYGPGTYPGNGDPEISVGSIVTRTAGIYRESSSLNATELVPPNDLSLGSSAVWSVTGEGSNGVFTLTNISELNISIDDYFSIGQNLVVLDSVVASGTILSLYREPSSPVYRDFGVDYLITGNYEIISLTNDSVTVTGFNFNFPTTELRPYTYYVKNVSDQELVFRTHDVELLDYTWYLTSTNEQLEYDQTNHFPDIGQSFSNITGPFILEPGTTSVIINLSSFQGFYKLSGSSPIKIDATVQVVIEEVDVNDNPTGNGIVDIRQYSSNPNNIKSSVYQTYDVSIPYGRARVYMSRLNDRDMSEEISNVDKIEWTSMYEFKPLPEGTDLGDVTLMHCMISSNSQSRLVKERQTNLTVTRLITEYLGNGNFGSTESFATNRFDQILIHTALDRYCGRLALTDINADNILDLYDEIVEYSGDTTMTEFGYDFDNSQVSYDDMFRIICEVVNCLPFIRNSRYDAFFEGEQTESTMQITHRNKINGTESRDDDFTETYDGVELTYRDNEDGISKTIYIPTDRSATSPEQIELPGCVNEIQATQKAWRAYQKQRYQRTTVMFDTDSYGLAITPGQRVDSPDSTRFSKFAGDESGYRIYDGEVVEVNGLSVELSQPVTFTEGEDHYIRFTNDTGGNGELILCTETDNPHVVLLSSLPTSTIYDGYDRDRTRFTFCSEQLRESIALIPYNIDLNVEDDGNETVNITFRNYDARIYENDVRAS